ncbi:MAG: SpoIIE family protein phosphatase [Anaerolineales bacterium]|nr:SpoIIE family protein phosphatase [Anaerolineales bacterium]
MTNSEWILAVALLASFALFLLLPRMLKRYSNWGEELSSLHDVSTAIVSAPADPEELAEIAFLETARVLETDFFQLGVFEGDAYRTILLVRDGNRQANLEFELDPEHEDIFAWIRRASSPLLITDFPAQQEKLPPVPGNLTHDLPRSGIFAPLKVEDKVIGVLAVQSRRSNAFDDNHLHLLSIVANGVASSLATIRMKCEVEYRTLQLVLIQEVSRRLISLQPLTERLFQAASLILQAFEYDKVLLYDYQNEELQLRAFAGNPMTEDSDPQSDHPTTPLVDRSAKEGVTLLDVLQMRPGERSAGERNNQFMELAVPFKVEDRILGVLDIHSGIGRNIPPEQISMAEMLAAQMAIAMLEARNFEQQQEENWITTVLLEVARHAAQPGDSELALQSVLQLIILLTGTNWAVLMLPEETEHILRVGTTAGLRRQMQDQVVSLRVPAQELGIEPPFPDDVSSHQIRLPAPVAEVLESEDSTALVLSDGVSLLGLLLLEGQELEGRRLSLLAGIAHQISLRLENTRLIDEAAARRSFERELDMARDIQSSFLPKALPFHSGWEIGATWGMAREVGGDFYDFIPLPDGPDGPRWGIVVADVADKGIPAALYMALCRTLIRSVAITRIDPGETLSRVNQLLFADSQAELFVSAFYALWEPVPALLTYANAGHNPPLLLEPETPAQLLTEHGMVLGVEETATYKSNKLTIAPGQLLVFYTDGVTEETGTRGEFFGLHRLESLVLGMQEWHAQEVADLIAERVSMFSGSHELNDDLTAVVLQRVPAG